MAHSRDEGAGSVLAADRETGARERPRMARTRRLVIAVWIIGMACVVAGSLAPGTSPLMDTVDQLEINDKVLHYGAYLVLSALPVIGFAKRRRGILAGLAMFLLGWVLEGAQSFVPGRSVEFADAMVNGAGTLSGVGLVSVVTRFLDRRRMRRR